MKITRVKFWNELVNLLKSSRHLEHAFRIGISCSKNKGTVVDQTALTIVFFLITLSILCFK